MEVPADNINAEVKEHGQVDCDEPVEGDGILTEEIQLPPPLEPLEAKCSSINFMDVARVLIDNGFLQTKVNAKRRDSDRVEINDAFQQILRTGKRVHNPNQTRESLMRVKSNGILPFHEGCKMLTICKSWASLVKDQCDDPRDRDHWFPCYFDPFMSERETLDIRVSPKYSYMISGEAFNVFLDFMNANNMAFLHWPMLQYFRQRPGPRGTMMQTTRKELVSAKVVIDNMYHRLEDPHVEEHPTTHFFRQASAVGRLTHLPENQKPTMFFILSTWLQMVLYFSNPPGAQPYHTPEDEVDLGEIRDPEQWLLDEARRVFTRCMQALDHLFGEAPMLPA